MSLMGHRRIALATKAFNSHHYGKIILLSIHVSLIFFFGIDLVYGVATPRDPF